MSQPGDEKSLPKGAWSGLTHFRIFASYIFRYITISRTAKVEYLKFCTRVNHVKYRPPTHSFYLKLSTFKRQLKSHLFPSAFTASSFCASASADRFTMLAPYKFIIIINNRHDNNHHNVYCAIIMTKGIARVHPVHLMN